MKFYGGRRRESYKPHHSAQAAGRISRIPRRFRILLIILLAAILLAGTAVAVYRAVSKPPERPQPIPVPEASAPDEPESVPETDEPEAEPEEEETLETELPASYRDGVYNILLCGTDGDGMRTDTIMIANLNTETNCVSLMSIPRDTLIGETYTVPKMNSSFAAGGVNRLKGELRKLLGFPVDGYVVIDLAAFIQIVDLVGGVDFDVPQKMYYSDPSQDLLIDLEAGPQHLDGQHAMQLVRYRKYANADIARIGVQQAFLRALAKQCVSIANLRKIGEFSRIIADCVDTDLTVGNMAWFGEQLLRCDFDKMQTYTPEGYGVMIRGASCYALYPSSVLQIVNEAFNPFDRPLALAELTVQEPPPEPEPEALPDADEEHAEIPEETEADSDPFEVLPEPEDETTSADTDAVNKGERTDEDTE